MNVLVTGFDPFGTETINPAYEAIALLPETIAGAHIYKGKLPTIFGEGGQQLKTMIQETRPELVLCVGQAGGRGSISFEQVAINLMEARIPDNAGNQPSGESIYSDGATAYFTNLPIKAMTKKVREAGIPASISYSAGTFVCNELMYQLLYTIDKEHLTTTRGGFVHVPFTLEQVINKAPNTPSMALEQMVRGLTIAIETAIKTQIDTPLQVGETE